MDFLEQVRARHGRLSGALVHLAASAQDRLGAFTQWRSVDLTGVERLVFVCAGNICRSAYAEARARRLGLSAASFGLEARTGTPADAHALQAAHARGIDLRPHRSTARAAFQPGERDLLVAMEPGHAMRLGARATLLGLWIDPPRPHLQDPFGLSRAYFGHCFALIDAAISGLRHALEKSR